MVVRFKRELNNFLAMLIGEQMVSNNTRDAYRRDLSVLLECLEKVHIGLSDASESFLQKYIDDLSSSGLKSNTVARKVSAIKTFFRFLVAEKELHMDPTVNLIVPKVSKSLPKALLQDDVKRLLEYDWPDKSPESIRGHAIVEGLYASGMRISELVTLKMEVLQFSPDKQLLPFFIIRGKGRKERMVMLYEKAADAFREYLAVRGSFMRSGSKADWVFPSVTKGGAVSHLSRQRVGQILKQIALEVGLDPALVSPHKLRHSFASHLLQNGANLRVVQELLGHADISSTQIYTKVLSADAANLVLKKHPLSV